MNNFLQRSITGILFVGILIGGIYVGKYSFISLFTLITMLSLWEFYTMTEKAGFKPQKLFGTFLGTSFFFLSSLYLQQIIQQEYLVLIFPLFFLIMIVELYRKPDHSIVNTSITIAGILYLTVPLVLLNYFTYATLYQSMGLSDYNPSILLGFFILIWTSDSFAYLIGVKFGKHKLFESVSPKKTWEGSIGGAVFTLFMACALSYFYKELPLTDWMVIGCLIVLFGSLGDLIQSKFKRSLNIKDSGNLLPGHGGILDRLDGVFLASPFIFTYLYLINQ